MTKYMGPIVHAWKRLVKISLQAHKKEIDFGAATCWVGAEGVFLLSWIRKFCMFQSKKV